LASRYAPEPTWPRGEPTVRLARKDTEMPTTPESPGPSPAVDRQRAAFADAPREYGLMPFWGWNDDLSEAELLRQVREMHAGGFGGFVPHADLGLPRSIGYLTDEFFRLLRLAIDEAARLGLKVILYDEGYYPSGSAQGKVVAENADYAARCLVPVERTVDGPARGFWRPNPGRAVRDALVSVVACREGPTGELDPSTFRLLEPSEHEVVGYDLPKGRWRLVSAWNVFSGGTIRGVFAEEDDGHALAPAAGDIMNPRAVAAFLRITHDAYYQHLGDHFGTTIVGMFTDEPDPLGRAPRRRPNPKPYSDGLLDELQPAWDGDVRLWLPALWHDCGARTEAFRHAYNRAVHDRIERVFFGAQGAWCAAHGIALTGHPGLSNEMGALRRFQWPGQDMVWRYVEPNKPTALDGAHSVAAKAASSAAALLGRERNTSELFGAYGWHITLDEIKWLFDWHMVRGTNLFVPGSCMYSLRGRRAFNSEPDVGYNNVWWPWFGETADYVRRVCWLLSGAHQVCDVAVLTDGNAMAWEAAKRLYQAQTDFIYIDDVALEGATLAEGRLVIGPQAFRAVVCDPALPEGSPLPARLAQFAEAGGLVVRSGAAADLPARLASALGRDLHWPGTHDLRALHCRRGGLDCYYLVNEGEHALAGNLTLRAMGALELWDPLDGSSRPWPAQVVDGRLATHLRLERRQGLVLVVDPAGNPDSAAPRPALPGDAVLAVSGPWRVCDTAGREVDAPALADWAQTPGWETFTGTLSFCTEFTAPEALAGRAAFLDLGAIGDIAELWLNGRRCGQRAWAPYVLEVGAALRPGRNRLEVRVTNSMANAYDGRQMPSGLLGPVVLRGAVPDRATLGEG
jgi:hypothetical protein